MTFLELARKAAQESGTVGASAQPVTVAGQTGRLGKITGWTADAWGDIQRSRRGWLWMQGEWTGATFSGVSAYTGAQLGATRWAEWSIRDDVFLRAAGEDTEDRLTYQKWDFLREARRYGSGIGDPARPIEWGVHPDGRLLLWPTPDAAYTLRGVYRRGHQRLVADGDVPEMPEDYHDLIWLGALAKIALFDEAAQIAPAYANIYRGMMLDLCNAQLPEIERAASGPLA